MECEFKLDGRQNQIIKEMEQRCWRKELDDKLKRFHSLFFGTDLTIERRDFESAYILGLQLLGFLDSNDADQSFTRHIRHDVASKVDASRRALIPGSDRRAFEQADKAPGTTFSMKAEIDIQKIKQSKYYAALIQHPNVKPVNELGSMLDRMKSTSLNTPKNMNQATLTSLYGSNIISRAKSSSYKSSLNSNVNNSDDCMILETRHSYLKNTRDPLLPRCVNIEDEDGHTNSAGIKRAHMDVSIPKNPNPHSPSSNKELKNDVSGNGFVTARAKLEMDARKKPAGSPCASVSPQTENPGRSYGARAYGGSRRGIRGNFVPPIKSNGGNTGNMTSRIGGTCDDASDDSSRRCLELLCGPDGELPERLRNLEPRLIEHVSNEIMDQDPNVRWDDIAGLEHAKKCVTEMIIWPLLRPDIFKGCRSPGRGLLLFGPPGTGKTMIGKAIAGEAKATFFYISASSLTSKWIGEGEKLVRALFGVASCRQPAVIFVDEIDSLLSQRKSEGEHDSCRRLKTQFLIEMEGFNSGNEQVLLIGATNRPQELDEAARRRLTKRLYIPLPSSEARAWIIQNVLEKDGLFNLSNEEIHTACKWTEGYSGSDMKNLVKDASMGPLREALKQGIEITKLKKEDMRPVTLQDFENALQEVRPSVSSNELGAYEDWNKQFGSLSL